MRLALLIAALLLSSVTLRAQEPLSFEPGGAEACAKATHTPIPGPNDNSRTFGYACAERDLQIEKAQFIALSRAIESRSPEERLAFNALMVSFTAFRDVDLNVETCHAGNSCPAYLEAGKAEFNHDFLQLVQQRTAVPPATVDELTAADAALNVSYEKIFALLPPACAAALADCQSQPMLRDAQRAWIRYRDAWGTFGVLHSPQVTRESWLTYLTRKRTEELKSSFHGES